MCKARKINYGIAFSRLCDCTHIEIINRWSLKNVDYFPNIIFSQDVPKHISPLGSKETKFIRISKARYRKKFQKECLKIQEKKMLPAGCPLHHEHSNIFETYLKRKIETVVLEKSGSITYKGIEKKDFKRDAGIVILRKDNLPEEWKEHHKSINVKTLQKTSEWKEAVDEYHKRIGLPKRNDEDRSEFWQRYKSEKKRKDAEYKYNRVIEFLNNIESVEREKSRNDNEIKLTWNEDSSVATINENDTWTTLGISGSTK